MSKETELSDEQIEKIAKTYIRSVGGYSCSEDAIPDNGKIEDFARAIIAADRELRRADAIAEYAAMTEKGAKAWADVPDALVRQSDAQAKLAAKDAEIAALKKKVGAYQLLTKSQDVRIATVRKLRDEASEAIGSLASERLANAMLTNEIDALKAEIDALRRIGGQLSNIAFNVSQNPDRVLSVAVCSTLDKMRKEWDAAIAKEKQK